MKRIPLICRYTVVGVISLAVMLIAACTEEAPPPKVVRPVKAIKVGDTARLTGRSFPGRAKATQEVNLSFRVSGTLMTLPNDIVGKTFKKGELIARLDPRDFEVQLQNTQGQLERAKAILARAEGEYKRERQIFQEDPGATSKTAVERKREGRDRAKANIKSLQASVAGAKDQLSYTYKKAPFDGRITAQYVQNFEDVRAKEPIVRLLDDSRVEMVVNIPESLISYAPHVTRVWVRFDPFPDKEIPATIKEIGTEASQTTRTYPVTLIMDQPEEFKILPGMAGQTIRSEGELPRDIQRQGIEVPVAAVFTPDTEMQSYIWVIDEKTMTVQKRKVKTGNLTEAGVLIEEGVKPGEWVVTAGVHTLREGQEVKILKGST